MLANFIAFQLGWFACVLGASHKLPALGSAFALVIVAWHLARCRSPWIELRLILSAALIGMVFDSSLAWSGWIGYDSGILLQGAAPYWIIVMWMLFATTLNASLSGSSARSFWRPCAVRWRDPWLTGEAPNSGP